MRREGRRSRRSVLGERVRNERGVHMVLRIFSPENFFWLMTEFKSRDDSEIGIVEQLLSEAPMALLG